MKRFKLYFKIPKQTAWYYWGGYKTRKGAIAAKDDASKRIEASLAKIIDCNDSNSSIYEI